MPTIQPRKHYLQAPLYLRKAFAYNTRDITDGILIGVLPAGSLITSVDVRVGTAFNGTGAVTLEVGTTVGDDDIVASSEIGVGNNLKDTAPVQYTMRPHFTDQKNVYIRVVDENEDSSAGSAIVALEFVQDNDG